MLTLVIPVCFTASMLADRSWLCIQGAAFVGGITAVLVALGLARLCRGDRLLVLILGGVVSTAFFTALLSAAKYVADPQEQLPAITYWLMNDPLASFQTFLHVAREAKERGLYVACASNAYFTSSSLVALSGLLDAINIGVKGMAVLARDASRTPQVMSVR